MFEQGSINTPMSDTALKQVLAQLSRAAVMRPLGECEKVLEMSKIASSKENSPFEGRKAEPACPCLGHAQDRPKHGVSPQSDTNGDVASCSDEVEYGTSKYELIVPCEMHEHHTLQARSSCYANYPRTSYSPLEGP